LTVENCLGKEDIQNSSKETICLAELMFVLWGC
jgi:hypothetical protein